MQQSPKPILSLSELLTGDQAHFLEIKGGKEVTSRLTSFGFTPGVNIVMTRNYGFGPVVVTLRGTRIALGREEARKIKVEKEQ